ncbi:hypothetical protein RVV73_001486 [Citrobacter freundii]|uniref:hypothetical protein n=1 Tax=Citrobacter TaxID=544 RepID=UPI0002B8738C|nr:MULTISPECIES: hypothetical protein [Citrobacter]ATX96555.1 hypothetical protein AM349_10855 [Citrobacter freundii]AUU27254.1 hypothetical protein MC62_015295 [Citrobacter freundii]AYL43398.1 hypothetical protein CUC45_14485 [Citrobacter freundii]EJR7284240.1 hypothetical protein [Citrobacter freundii]EKT8564439.1 hypothetical protein [Citrobacter freundii]
MTSSQNRPPVIERFYTHLDETIAQGLTPEQKEGVENAILASTLASRHQIDIRRSFPFFSKRYYLVFLFGRDLRRQHRQESTLSRMLLTFLLLIAVLFVTCCILLTLYMIKSALGIDVFQNFHVGIWDWWLSLKDR